MSKEFPYHKYYFDEKSQNTFIGRPQNLLPKWIYNKEYIKKNLSYLDIDFTPKSKPSTPDQTRSDTLRTDINIHSQTEMATARSDLSKRGRSQNSIDSVSVVESHLTLDSREGRTTYKQIKERVDETIFADDIREINRVIEEVEQWCGEEVDYVSKKREKYDESLPPTYLQKMDKVIETTRARRLQLIHDLMTAKKENIRKQEDEVDDLLNQQESENLTANEESMEQRIKRYHDSIDKDSPPDDPLDPTRMADVQQNIDTKLNSESQPPNQNGERNGETSLIQLSSGRNSRTSQGHNGDMDDLRDHLTPRTTTSPLYPMKFNFQTNQLEMDFPPVVTSQNEQRRESPPDGTHNEGEIQDKIMQAVHQKLEVIESKVVTVQDQLRRVQRIALASVHKIEALDKSIEDSQEERRLAERQADTAQSHIRHELSEINREVTTSRIKLEDVRRRQEENKDNTRQDITHTETMLAKQIQQIRTQITELMAPSKDKEEQKMAESRHDEEDEWRFLHENQGKHSPKENDTPTKPKEPDTFLRYGSTISDHDSSPDQSLIRRDSPVPITDPALAQSAAMQKIAEAMLALATNQTPRQTHGQLPKLNARDFNGKWEEAEDWLREFISVAQANNWSDQSKVRQAKHHLRGSAADWYAQEFRSGDNEIRADADEFLPTWSEFVEKFCKYYVPEETRIMAERTLHTCRKSNDETYMEYFARMMKLFNKADPHMPEVKKVFNLRNGITDNATLQSTTGMKTAEAFKEHFRTIDIYKVSRERQLPKEDWSTTQNHRSDSRPSSPSTDSGMSTDDNRKDDKATKTKCYSCGKRGHKTDRCPAPISREKQRQLAIQKEIKRTGQHYRAEPWLKSMTPSKSEHLMSANWPVEELQTDGEEDQPTDQETMATNSLQIFNLSMNELMATAKEELWTVIGETEDTPNVVQDSYIGETSPDQTTRNNDRELFVD